MMLWDYIEEKNMLSLRRIDNGKTYRVTVECKTAGELARWLKFYEMLDIDHFKVCSQLDNLKTKNLEIIEE